MKNLTELMDYNEVSLLGVKKSNVELIIEPDEEDE